MLDYDALCIGDCTEGRECSMEIENTRFRYLVASHRYKIKIVDLLTVYILCVINLRRVLTSLLKK